MQGDERLLKLYESGLPAWAVHMPLWGLCYRPWLRKATYALFVCVSVFSMVMGFYDLLKNVPFLHQARPPSRLASCSLQRLLGLQKICTGCRTHAAACSRALRCRNLSTHAQLEAARFLACSTVSSLHSQSMPLVWQCAGAAEPGGAHAPAGGRHLPVAGQLAEGTASPALPAQASASPPLQAAGVPVISTFGAFAARPLSMAAR